MVTILYVEDSRLFLDNIIPFLERRGHAVKGAENGQEGLEILTQEDAIHIIFSDYDMPVMNGYDFCKAVKTDQKYVRHSGVPIVGVGDFPDNKREHLVRCMEKPFTPDELVQCIDEHCK